MAMLEYDPDTNQGSVDALAPSVDAHDLSVDELALPVHALVLPVLRARPLHSCNRPVFQGKYPLLWGVLDF